tara:strand:- start:69 stop:488 length:420 start_codon:yes stop_codon:yes gene_type:complete
MTLVLIAILVLVFLYFYIATVFVGNPRVMAELQAEPDGQLSGLVGILTLPDERKIPVNYLHEEKQVFLGADGPWWRDFRGDGAEVVMWIKGNDFRGRATVKLGDSKIKDRVFPIIRPRVPDWLPDFLNAKLVVIQLYDG